MRTPSATGASSLPAKVTDSTVSRAEGPAFGGDEHVQQVVRAEVHLRVGGGHDVLDQAPVAGVEGGAALYAVGLEAFRHAQPGGDRGLGAVVETAVRRRAEPLLGLREELVVAVHRAARAGRVGEVDHQGQGRGPCRWRGSSRAGWAGPRSSARPGRHGSCRVRARRSGPGGWTRRWWRAPSGCRSPAEVLTARVSAVTRDRAAARRGRMRRRGGGCGCMQGPSRHGSRRSPAAPLRSPLCRRSGGRALEETDRGNAGPQQGESRRLVIVSQVTPFRAAVGK